MPPLEPSLGREKGRLTPLMLSRIYMKKASKDCQNTKIRILKSIRLDLTELKSFVNQTSYKIVVLFRDPRAIMNSIELSPDFWTNENHDHNFICQKLSRNFQEAKNLQLKYPDKVRILKYEDFIEEKLKTVKDLYDFLGISYLVPYPKVALRKHVQNLDSQKWTKIFAGEKMPKIPEVPKFLARPSKKLSFSEIYSKIKGERKRKFFKAKKFNTLVEHGSFRYYSTFRSKAFQHDHWKQELSMKNILDLQNSSYCKKSMHMLNYSLYNPNNEV